MRAPVWILCVIAGATTSAMADPDFIDSLIPVLARTADARTVVAKPPASVKVTSGTGTWSLTFPARDTKAALAKWGWTQVYAVSGDVHQTTFEIRQRTGALSKDRIATIDPHGGRWAMRVTLTKRPEGPLPKLVAGASPAYDLPGYASSFDRIEIVPREISEIEAALKAIKKPTVADVERELGPSDGDIGSGIHIYEYKLATRILVGSADGKSVLYIKVGDRDLYRKN